MLSETLGKERCEMKKLQNIVVMLCTLVLAAAMWIQAGPQFVKLLAGPVPLEPGDDLSQAEGQYISYEAAYPVASCVEEYYSGDQSRARTNGYVVYDAERQIFFYVVVGERNDGRYSNLMYYLGMTGEIRAEKNMEPAEAEGSLELMDWEAIEKAVAALNESDILDIYDRFEKEGEYYKAYFGDDYGRVMETMCEQFFKMADQSEWYRIDCGVINGMATLDIWICALTGGLNLLIALKSLISLLFGGRKKGTKNVDPDSAVGRFFSEQRVWVEDWCRYIGRRLGIQTILTVVICVAVFLVIGYFSGSPMPKILSFYLPLGLLLGEVVWVLMSWIQNFQANPEKLLKRIEKRLRKAFPSPGAMEAYAEDFLKAGKEWEFREQKKGVMIYGRLGDHCWSAFYSHGMVTLVDVESLARVEPEDTVGSVRSGKVRVGYESHNAKFYYKNTPAWENGDKVFGFETKEARDTFLALAEKKGAEGVKVRMN